MVRLLLLLGLLATEAGNVDWLACVELSFEFLDEPLLCFLPGDAVLETNAAVFVLALAAEEEYTTEATKR